MQQGKDLPTQLKPLKVKGKAFSKKDFATVADFYNNG